MPSTLSTLSNAACYVCLMAGAAYVFSTDVLSFVIAGANDGLSFLTSCISGFGDIEVNFTGALNNTIRAPPFRLWWRDALVVGVERSTPLLFYPGFPEALATADPFCRVITPDSLTTTYRNHRSVSVVLADVCRRAFETEKLMTELLPKIIGGVDRLDAELESRREAAMFNPSRININITSYPGFLAYAMISIVDPIESMFRRGDFLRGGDHIPSDISPAMLLALGHWDLLVLETQLAIANVERIIDRLGDDFDLALSNQQFHHPCRKNTLSPQESGHKLAALDACLADLRLAESFRKRVHKHILKVKGGMVSLLMLMEQLPSQATSRVIVCMKQEMDLLRRKVEKLWPMLEKWWNGTLRIAAEYNLRQLFAAVSQVVLNENGHLCLPLPTILDIFEAIAIDGTVNRLMPAAVIHEFRAFVASSSANETMSSERASQILVTPKLSRVVWRIGFATVKQNIAKLEVHIQEQSGSITDLQHRLRESQMALEGADRKLHALKTQHQDKLAQENALRTSLSLDEQQKQVWKKERRQMQRRISQLERDVEITRMLPDQLIQEVEVNRMLNESQQQIEEELREAQLGVDIADISVWGGHQSPMFDPGIDEAYKCQWDWNAARREVGVGGMNLETRRTQTSQHEERITPSSPATTGPLKEELSEDGGTLGSPSPPHQKKDAWIQCEFIEVMNSRARMQTMLAQQSAVLPISVPILVQDLRDPGESLPVPGSSKMTEVLHEQLDKVTDVPAIIPEAVLRAYERAVERHLAQWPCQYLVDFFTALGVGLMITDRAMRSKVPKQSCQLADLDKLASLLEEDLDMRMLVAAL
ncbi:hypothetical protein EV421DRAFT_1745120 [Armillaria borealis]|uniref:Uncharacterized protein n=1 Tax=Armillaria borealis TaxID=47425 RepID=A0AA39ITW7_9AGAR|nr:hypothetical protein EV421DRAFT_1745120 [Armillaria borealis]